MILLRYRFRVAYLGKDGLSKAKPIAMSGVAAI
jgi:hypothetical protein